jgi:hypothetical protein
MIFSHVLCQLSYLATPRLAGLPRCGCSCQTPRGDGNSISEQPCQVRDRGSEPGPSSCAVGAWPFIMCSSSIGLVRFLGESRKSHPLRLPALIWRIDAPLKQGAALRATRNAAHLARARCGTPPVVMCRRRRMSAAVVISVARLAFPAENVRYRM